MIRALLLGVCVWGVAAGVAGAQEAPPPAFLAVVEGNATLEREGEVVPAEQNMPFVQGDRLRTLDGRVQIVFPDGTAIEVAENSEVECISPTRVRLLAGTMDHVQRAIGGSQSATHLPPELDVYGQTFDQYGSWQYDAPYGYVWYPTVAADWRPYHYGYWSSVPRYGYTWIGVDVFAWPTHHYGRWGFARNRWFWIPGRAWGPAWVSWASAPGYVSWCPLGFDSRPVFGFSVRVRTIVGGLDDSASQQLRRSSVLRASQRRGPATHSRERRIRRAQRTARLGSASGPCELQQRTDRRRGRASKSWTATSRTSVARRNPTVVTRWYSAVVTGRKSSVISGRDVAAVAGRNSSVVASRKSAWRYSRRIADNHPARTDRHASADTR